MYGTRSTRNVILNVRIEHYEHEYVKIKHFLQNSDLERICSSGKKRTKLKQKRILTTRKQ